MGNPIVNEELRQDSCQLKSRLWLVSGAHLSASTGALIVLNQAWYKNYPRSGFHFHDDLPDWFQQDKLGHLIAGYYLSRISSETFRWAGMDNNRSALWGSLAGSTFLASIEILDGFSEQWGASTSDLVANTMGSVMFAGQQFLWDEQRITIKYSYSGSGLARYRPGLLGSSLPAKMLKDYNAQTYWLSVNLSSFFPESNLLPPWLNIAVGHGANGMLGSRVNPYTHNDLPLPQLIRYREWYLAPDIDLTRIPVNNPWLKRLLHTLNLFKLPTPAIEFNSVSGLKFHWIFF
ncbi:MAG TPA: DUF2279 domain-containing protein [Bacteroidales bacterium]|nr:DUF2279 domain-containing protein [Bacteroidales bacterium]